MRKLLCIVSIVTLLCASCSEERRNDIVAPRSHSEPEVPKVPDGVGDDGGTIGRFYDSDNPYTVNRIDRLTRESRVVDAVKRFTNVGYRYRADVSFVIEGDLPDGSHGEAVVLAMENVKDPLLDAIELVCMETDETLVIIPLRVRTPREGDSTDGLVAGQLVVESAEPSPSSISVGAPATEAFKWKQYGKCVANSLAGATLSCAVTCSFLPVLFLPCMGICMASSLAGAMVGCAFQQIW